MSDNRFCRIRFCEARMEGKNSSTQIRDIRITRRSSDMGPGGSDGNVLCLDHGTDCVPMSSSKLNECDFMHFTICELFQ